MEQSPSSEANSHSASQEIPCILWNPKFHYHVHKTPPLLPVLRQMNTFHTFPSYFPKILSNIILPSTPSYFEWSLPLKFSDQILYAFLMLAMLVTFPTHLILHVFIA
jgi:hypothetical protein